MTNNGIPELKMILLGESGVGKTSIIKRYLNDQFDRNEQSTMSMSYVAKTIEVDKKKITLNIWDTIGQEKYRSISKLFLNETKIVILVYDITSMHSFKELDYWYGLCQELLGPEIILGVAGNKMDLYLEQEVPDDQVKEFTESKGAIFSLLSAKENKDTVDLYINKLVKAYLDKNETKSDEKDNQNDNNGEKKIKLEQKNINSEGNNNGGCCGGKEKNRKKTLMKNGTNCIFLGDNGVGKTSLIKILAGKELNKNEKHTNKTTETVINYNNSSKPIKFNIYDIDNNIRSSKEIIEIIVNCKVIFLVYNLFDKESFDNIEKTIEDIKKYKKNENLEKYLLVIIGNGKESSSLDSNGEGIVINQDDKNRYIEEGKKLANDNKGIFKEISNLKNNELENLLGEIVEKLKLP